MPNQTDPATISDELREQHLSCPICFENYDNDHIPRFLPCGHTFCNKCIPTFLKDSMACPICKAPVRGSKDQQFPTNFAINGMIRSTNTTEESEINWKGVDAEMKKMKEVVDMATKCFLARKSDIESFVKIYGKSVNVLKEVAITTNAIIGSIEDDIRGVDEGLKKLKSVGDVTSSNIQILRDQMELFMKTCELRVDQTKNKGIEQKEKTPIIPANVQCNNLEVTTNRGAPEVQNRQADRQAQHVEHPVVDPIFAGEVRGQQDRRRRRLHDLDVVDPAMIALAPPRLLPPARFLAAPRPRNQQGPPIEPLQRRPPIDLIPPPRPSVDVPTQRQLPPLVSQPISRAHEEFVAIINELERIGMTYHVVQTPQNSSSANDQGSGGLIHVQGQSTRNNGASASQPSVNDPTMIALAPPWLLPPARSLAAPVSRDQQGPPFEPLQRRPPIDLIPPPQPSVDTTTQPPQARVMAQPGSTNCGGFIRAARQISSTVTDIPSGRNSSSAGNGGAGGRIQVGGQSSSNNGASVWRSLLADRRVLRSGNKRPRTESE